MFVQLTRPFLRQYFIVILVNLSMLSVGLNMGWASPVLVKLTNATHPILEEPLTEDQGSWVVSVGVISGLIANFLVASLADRIGRKCCFIVAAIPRIVGQILLTFMTNFWMLMVGRVIGGLGDAMTMGIVPMYAAEIASNEIRGSLGMVLQIFCSLGIVTMLCMGPYLDYFLLNSIVLGISIVTAIPLLFLPDSPCYLLRKDKKDEALRVLTYLRNTTFEAEEELKQYKLNMENDHTNIIDILKSGTVAKTFIIMIIFGAGTQLTGYNAVSPYLQTIFESSKTNVSPEISSVIIGCIQLFACFCTLAVIDRFGRKPIISTCLVGMAIGLIGLGTFFHLSALNISIEGFLNYLPLISLILIVFSYSAGLGSLMWPLMSEVFDSKCRAIGMSSVLCSIIVFAFLTQKFFATLLSTIGPATTYWIFSINTIVLCVFILFCIPETKGKSFAEIQTALKGK